MSGSAGNTDLDDTDDEEEPIEEWKHIREFYKCIEINSVDQHLVEAAQQ